MTRAVIYARFSSDSQSPDTIDVQIAECVKYCEREGYEVVGRYTDEARTGRTEHLRTNYLRMIADVENDIYDVVVAHRYNRLGRTFFEAVRAIYEIEHVHESRVESAAEGKDPLTRNILLSVADDFSRKLSETVKVHMTSRAEKGERLARPPYGYYREDGEIMIDDEEAQTVRLIFDLRVENGFGYRRISNELYERGIPSPAGKRTWSSVSVRNVLNNPFYCGDTVWNVREVKRNQSGARRHVIRPIEDWITGFARR